MTTSAFAPAPTYTISGIGPYDAPFEYGDAGEIKVSILVTDVLETVDPADYSVVPSGPATSGTVFLTAAFATDHDGETLVLERDTAIDQSWIGLGSTAAELEAQLDAMARAIQENQTAADSSLRVISNVVSPYEPQDGRVPYWDNSIGSFANGLDYATLAAGIAAASSAYDTVNVAFQAISGGKWRADVPTLLADTALTYLADQTGTVEEGDKIVTQAEGFGYLVAADTATKFDLVTAGGVKLSVLPTVAGYDVRAFGAVGDGVTDDSAAIQAALDSIDPDATLNIPAGTYKITSTPEIPLSTSEARLTIVGYGATFQITGAIAGLARERPVDVNSTFTNAKIIVRGLTIEGDRTIGQHGFRFYTTYGLSVEDCHAIDCDIGFLSVFGLAASFERCFATNCVKYGFYFACGASQIDFGSGAESALSGGNAINSASNGTIASLCRVFSLSGSVAHFRTDATEMVYQSCIAEGNAGDYCFYYENLGASTSKGIRIVEPHVECAPTEAVYRIGTTSGTMGGTYTIDGQYVTINTLGWTTSLIDLGSITPNCTIVMVNNKTIYNVTSIAKGSNTTRHPHFLVNTIDHDVWLDAGNWETGIVGNISSMGTTYNSTNEGALIATDSLYFSTGYTNWSANNRIDFNASNRVNFNMVGANRDVTIDTGSVNFGLVLKGQLYLQDAVSGAFTTLGTLQGRLPIYDETKTLIGYVPLYSSVT